MKEYLKKADILGLAIIAAAVISYSVQHIWTPYQTIALVLGGVIILASLVVKSGEIREGLGRRSTKFGINSAVSVVFFVAVLGLVNYLGAQHVKRVDMTTEKIYSLSDQSANVVQQIKQDLHIRAFYPGGEYGPVKDLLELYKGKNSKISYEFIDPDKQPQLAQQYTVTQYGDFQNPMTGERLVSGTLVLEMAGKTERIEKQNEAVREEDVTNALMKIVKGEKKTIYFTEQHGEKGIADAERTGYSIAKGQLEKENYTVKPVNLITEGKVPDDAAALVIAGPTAEFFPPEIEALDAYLNKGGSVLVMLDPPPGASMADFLKKWSIDVGNNVVLDPTGLGRLFQMGPAAPLASHYGTHRITERLRTVTFFPFARSMAPAATPAQGLTVEKLVETNERSWGETDIKNNQAKFDEGKDVKGPVTIATVASKDLGNNKKVRLVAFGYSDFASNMYYDQGGNSNLFLNTISWLAQDENFISIRPKDPADRRLTLTEAQGRLVSFVMLLFLPGSVLVAGISVWMKRRK